MKKILIAGANGIIGSFLCNRLSKKNIIFTTGLQKKLNKSHYISADLTNLHDTKKLCNNIDHCDILIFLVGLAHKKGKRKELDKFELINKITLVNLIQVLDETNKLPDKIIFSSTISVYGENRQQLNYDETTKKYPINSYAITKSKAEEFLLNNYRKQSWILRFAPVYSLKFRLNIYRRTKIGNLFYRIGNGSKKLSLCNIKNINDVVDNIIDGNIPNDVYNVSDPIIYTYNDLLLWSGSKWKIIIPEILLGYLYNFAKIINNNFLIENIIKLTTDNIYPSNKLQKYMKLSSNLKDKL